MLSPTEYNTYYQPYVDLTTNPKDCVDGMRQNLSNVVKFYRSLPKEKLDFAYAKGKWTVKDILMHCIDTERIFSYRALRIARQDKTPMAGFEQDGYVVSANAKNRSIDSLLNEYITLRNTSIVLFESFTNEQLKSIGTASNSLISARAIGYIISGHENHHVQIIKERYL